MEYVTLGKTGLKISRLGFGGIPIQRVDAAVTKELAKAMVEKGINYIDTARGYTVSESYIGEALDGKNKRSNGSRYRNKPEKPAYRLYRSVSDP